jgi:hypothetical protein
VEDVMEDATEKEWRVLPRRGAQWDAQGGE